MPEWVLDWNLWALVATIVFGVAGIVFWWLGRLQERKRLGFEVISNSPVIGSSDVERDDWEINFRGTRLVDPYVMVFQIENTGRVAIKPEDFEPGQPIKVVSSDGAEFVAISHLRRYPRNLSLDMVLSATELQIKPMLMNAGEGFYLYAVTEGECVPKLSARIAGLEPEFKEIPVKSIWLVPLRVAYFTAILAAVEVSVSVGLLAYDYLAGEAAAEWVGRLGSAFAFSAVLLLAWAGAITALQQFLWKRKFKS